MGVKRNKQLSPGQFIQIKNLYNQGFSQSKIAKMFDCNQSHISRILRGQACSYICLIDKTMATFKANVKPAKNESPQAKTLRAKRNRLFCTKLTWKKVKRLRKMYFSGKYTQMDLAKKFGIHQSTVTRIVRAITWKELK